MPNQPRDALYKPDPKLAGIVRITEQSGPTTWQDSGVLISPDEVLTASHAVWFSRPGGGGATDIVVTPQADAAGVRPYGIFSGKAAHYSTIADDGAISYADSERDFAVIHLDKPVSGVTPWALGDGSFSGGPVTVSGYPASASGTRVDTPEVVRVDPSYPGLFDGTSIGAGSSGGPVWTLNADGQPQVVGVVSSGFDNGPGFFARLTPEDIQQVQGWVKQDDIGLVKPLPPQLPAVMASVLIHDGTTNADIIDTLTRPYEGAVTYLQNQFVDLSPDNLNITATAPNLFIHTGGGNDAIALLSGTNVVDGGTGSNYLAGGSGTDTFFVDSRGASSDIWSSVVNFHAGDAATLWGLSPTNASIAWVNNEGAVGATGLTLHATAAGKPTASLTLAGLSTADLNGKITAQYGHNGGDDYFYIHET